MTSVPFFEREVQVVLDAGPQPRPGSGVRLTTNALGTTYAVPGGSPNYRHPFKCYLGAGVVQIRPGLVEGVFTPKIGGKPMTDAGVVLKLDAKKVNGNGESWAVLEVEPNEEGILDDKSRIEIVQLAQVDLHEDKTGRQPLAQILFKQGSPQRLLSIVTFNLRYRRVKHATGPVDHLFF